ncbi:MAG: aminopeptidase, partial [Desulfatiglandales bacterium]
MTKGELTKKEIKRLRERLEYKARLVWDVIPPAEKKEVFALGEVYKKFLDRAKTEREAVAHIRRTALENGFSENPAPGSCRPFFRAFHGKSIALVRPCKGQTEQGVRLIVSHLDAPRLDLKQKPLYEEADLSFLKTHYYGGIKKFQWLARPLALHGRIIRGDGETIDLAVGEDPADPVFTILDLLPHLARKTQYEKKLALAIPGEKLNLLAGSLPLGEADDNCRFKLAVLEYLSRTYGLVEEDLISAELEVVPAEKARDVGWDRALVGAYGQDDRICAFASLKAVLDTTRNDTAAVVLFVDKEEIGSDGATSAKSRFIESVIGDLLQCMGQEPDSRAVFRMLSSSRALSGDVTGALDPDYPEVHEKRNAARLGYGLCLT